MNKREKGNREMTQSYTTAATIGQILAKLPKPKWNAASANSTDNSAATDCRSCHGIEECQYSSHRGYRPVTTERGTALEACHHLNAWKIRKRQDNLQAESGLPAQYRNLTFKDFKADNGNYQALIAATELKSLYLWGESNTGKTLLLSLIGNAHIDLGHRVLYTTATELLLQLRYNSDTCEDRLRQYQTIPTLLIDDLGTERVNDYGEEQLYMVLDGRHRHSLTTVLSSHLSLEELIKRYNTRLGERIKQTIEREEHLQ